MKILRYLLSHITLILIILALVLVFYYRDFLFPERVNASIDDSITALAFWRAEKSDGNSQADADPEGVDATSTSATYSESAEHVHGRAGTANETQGEAPDSATQRGEQQASDAAGTPEPSVAEGREESAHQESAGNESVETEAAADIQSTAEASAAQAQTAARQGDGIETGAQDTAGAMNEADTAGVKAQPESQAKPVMDDGAAPQSAQPVAQAPATPSGAATDSPDAGTEADADAAEADTASQVDQESASQRTNRLIRQAREAYQQGNMQEAVEYYQAFIENDPKDPNAYGELGNIYYEQGQWDKAGDAYYEAAVRLLAIGETSQVEYLLRVIRGLKPEHAQKLEQKMAGK